MNASLENFILFLYFLQYFLRMIFLYFSYPMHSGYASLSFEQMTYLTNRGLELSYDALRFLGIVDSEGVSVSVVLRLAGRYQLMCGMIDRSMVRAGRSESNHIGFFSFSVASLCFRFSVVL